MKTLRYSLQAIEELRDIVKNQTETLQMFSENISLMRREITHLQKRTYDLNSRLVDIEEFIDEKSVKFEEKHNEFKL